MESKWSVIFCYKDDRGNLVPQRTEVMPSRGKAAELADASKRKSFLVVRNQEKQTYTVFGPKI